MTINELIRELGDIAGRFDIDASQADRIAKKAICAEDPEAEFVRIWENEAWWVAA